MEGDAAPAEITSIIRELRTVGEGSVATGTWLAEAMENTWATATILLGYEQLSDLVGDRHRIIANDWQAAVRSVASRAVCCSAAADVLDAIDFTPGGAPCRPRRVSAGTTTPALCS